MNITTNQTGKIRKSRKWKWLAAFFLVIGGLLFWWHVNPLPSDEEMIAHFYAHRGEIETLVKSYREFMPTPEKLVWEHLSENKMLMQKAKVQHVGGGGPIWFHNPYSVEAAKQFDADLKAGKLPGFDLRSYKTIYLTLDDQHHDNDFRWVLLSSGPKIIFKHLAYFPEVPKIEGGILVPPARAIPLPAAWLIPWPSPYRVFPSLNDYPPGWKKNGECVFRQIESQWFLIMCIAAV